MYENQAQTQKQAAYAGQGVANQAIGYGSVGATDAIPRDLTASELIQNRLRQFHEMLSHNNTRLIEIGGRAFGGNPVGGRISGNAQAAPQPAGHIAAISMALDEIQQMLEVQREAISFVEKLA